MSEYLSPHFTAAELNGTAAPAWIREALVATAAGLETIRGILGVALRVTDGWDNGSVVIPGRVSDSQHKDGTAADFKPLGLSPFTAYGMLTAAIQRRALAVGELIFYTGDGHIHYARATRADRNQVLIKVGTASSGSKYLPATADTVAMLPGAPGGAAGTLAVLGALGLVIAASNSRPPARG